MSASSYYPWVTERIEIRNIAQGYVLLLEICKLLTRKGIDLVKICFPMACHGAKHAVDVQHRFVIKWNYGSDCREETNINWLFSEC